MTDLIITNAVILPFDPSGTAIDGGDLVIADGKIAALGPGAAAGRTAARAIDGSGLLVMPGLVNGHTHSPENLAKGVADRMTLDAWLAAVWHSLDALTPEEIRIAALVGCAEMLRTGSTSVVDHFRQTPLSADALMAVVRAYDEAGLRAVIPAMVRDRNPVRPVPPAKDQLSLIEAASRHLRNHARVRIGIGPSAPARCSDELLRGAASLAQEQHLVLHMHVDETRDDAAAAHSAYGRSAVRHLADIGVLSPALSLAHGTWLEPADIDLLAATGAMVIHNPVSNMRLGSGIAPVAALKRAGVAVALGSDGAASNDGQNMFEVVKAALLLQRVSGTPPKEWLSAAEALGMATTVAARRFGFGSGTLAVGQPADLIAIDRRAYALTPANDWHRQLAFGAAGVDVRYAVVGGELRLDDGRITGFDEAAVLEEARRIGARLHGSAAP